MEMEESAIFCGIGKQSKAQSRNGSSERAVELVE